MCFLIYSLNEFNSVGMRQFLFCRLETSETAIIPTIYHSFAFLVRSEEETIVNLNGKWFVGLVGLVLVLVSIWLFKSLKQDQLSRRIQQKQLQAESANYESLHAQAQEMKDKSSTMAKKEGEQANETFQQSPDEQSPLDEKEKEIQKVPSSDEGVQEQELAKVQTIQARIKTLETQLQEYKQQIDALARQTGEFSKMRGILRSRRDELLSSLSRETGSEARKRIMEEITSIEEEITQWSELQDEVVSEMRTIGLKYVETRNELHSLQDELDLLNSLQKELK